MSEQLASRRAPSAYALALVVTLTAAGMLLRWWGPINPSIRVDMTNDLSSVSGYGTSGFQTDWKVDGTAHLTLQLANGSHSPVTVKRVRVVPVSDSVRLPLPNVEVRNQPTRLSPEKSVAMDVTLVAAPACAAWLARQPAQGRTIPPDQGKALRSGQFSVVTDLRTSSGRTKTVGRNIQLSDICPTQSFLPTPGVQPADPTDAKHLVTVAFWSAYDTRNSLDDRASFIDDVTGIPRLLPGGVRSQVHDIVFTSPGSATVVYDVYFDGKPLVINQLGHAHVVDGTWKVTRETVCRDVVLANQSCN